MTTIQTRDAESDEGAINGPDFLSSYQQVCQQSTARMLSLSVSRCRGFRKGKRPTEAEASLSPAGAAVAAHHQRHQGRHATEN